MSPAKAWALIAEIGWGTKSTNTRALAKEWYKEIGTKGMEDLAAFVDARASDLYSAVRKYESEQGDLEVGSDDGFSDLRYHVVGLGQAEFEKAFDNPELLQRRYQADEYTESFAYVFQKPDPPRTKADKEKSVDKLLEAAQSINRTIRDIVNLQNILQAKQHEFEMLIGVVTRDRLTPEKIAEIIGEE